MVAITLTPQLVRGGLEGECVVQCRVGNFHTVALTETGRVFVFGSSISGQLGTGEMKAQIDVPQILRGSLEAVRVVFISAGAVHTVCTTDQGRMYTWGMNDTGQLGQGDRINRCIPTFVDETLEGTESYLLHQAASRMPPSLTKRSCSCGAGEIKANLEG